MFDKKIPTWGVLVFVIGMIAKLVDDHYTTRTLSGEMVKANIELKSIGDKLDSVNSQVPSLIARMNHFDERFSALSNRVQRVEETIFRPRPQQ